MTSPRDIGKIAINKKTKIAVDGEKESLKAKVEAFHKKYDPALHKIENIMGREHFELLYAGAKPIYVDELLGRLNSLGLPIDDSHKRCELGISVVNLVDKLKEALKIARQIGEQKLIESKPGAAGKYAEAAAAIKFLLNSDAGFAGLDKAIVNNNKEYDSLKARDSQVSQNFAQLVRREGKTWAK